MKIITDSACYVQRNDLGFLNTTSYSIPASIFNKAFNNSCTIINDRNRYDFVKFDEESEIEFFRSLDWIVDYNDVKDLTDSEIYELTKVVRKEHEKIAHSYNDMSNEDKANNYCMVIKCNLLEFKFYSLRDILWFKQGHIRMNFPSGFQIERVKRKKHKR